MGEGPFKAKSQIQIPVKKNTDEFSYKIFKHAGKTIQEKLKTKCKLGESILSIYHNISTT